MNFDIDIVYAWADGNCLTHQALYRQKFGRDATYCRFATNHELYYSLYSIAQFAPWVRNVFIIVAAYQRPNLDHLPRLILEKIIFVEEDEILPKEALPVFNSMAIETCLYRIPGLAEHFIYFNDDMFFGREVTPSDFFSETGECFALVNQLPKQNKVNIPSHDWLIDFLQTMGVYQQFIIHEGGVLDLSWIDKLLHQCYPCRKSILAFMANHEIIHPAIRRTTFSAGRQSDNIKTIHLMYLIGQLLNLIQLKKWDSERFILLTDHHPLIARLKLFWITMKQPKLFCINNDLKKENHRIETILRLFFRQFYHPKKNSIPHSENGLTT